MWLLWPKKAVNTTSKGWGWRGRAGQNRGEISQSKRQESQGLHFSPARCGPWANPCIPSFAFLICKAPQATMVSSGNWFTYHFILHLFSPVWSLPFISMVSTLVRATVLSGLNQVKSLYIVSLLSRLLASSDEFSTLLTGESAQIAIQSHNSLLTTLQWFLTDPVIKNKIPSMASTPSPVLCSCS